jgi:hypothetical protein
MKTKIKLLCLFLIQCFGLRAQDAPQLINNLLLDDSAAVTALALYPENTRKNILEACSYPESLVRIEALQKSTGESFRKELEAYSKEEQQKIWDLSRYPELIVRLGQEKKQSGEEVEKIVSEYPEEIRETAIDYGTNHHDVLVKVNILNKNSEQAFESLIKEYPEKTRTSLRELIKYPEIINILTSDMKMSVLVGDIYKKQPLLIEQKLDSISTDHARKNAKDLEEWKSGLEKNPQAKKEMEEASREFAKDQGYKEEDLSVRNETVIVNYVVHPYPYWVGYPWWYDYPYWYPYPYWYDLGYYWAPQGIVYIGFPSPYFTHWYFHHPHHHYHYNHFSDYCVGYYYGHHKSVTGFNSEVSGWVKSKETTVPRNFFANDAKRPDRIKELGQFEIDYEKSVKDNPVKNITRDDFLKNNVTAYPNISPVLAEPKPKETPSAIYEKPKPISVYQEQPRPRPIIKTPQEFKPAPQPLPRPKPMPMQPKPRPIPQQKSNTPIRSPIGESNLPKDDFSKMNEAEFYHRSKWNGE